MKNKSCLLLLPLLLALSACSAIDVAYNNAPSLVAGRIDDVFDLNDEQDQQLDSRLQSFFDWHRSEELTRYQQVLDQAANYAGDGISATEFLALNQQLEQAWERSLSHAIDNLGDLATSLSPAQIQQYRDYYREKTEKHDKYLSKTPQQRQLMRARRSLDRLQNWFGDFDDDLWERVINRLQQLPDLYQPWIEYRQARHLMLVRLFEQQNDPEQLKRDLYQILLKDDSEHARAFRPARVAYLHAYAEALEEISGWLTPEQRQYAVKKLQKYAQIASRLSKG